MLLSTFRIGIYRMLSTNKTAKKFESQLIVITVNVRRFSHLCQKLLTLSTLRRVYFSPVLTTHCQLV